MPEYARPPIPEQTFRDALGRVIEYGNRWPDGDGPDDSYEVVSHPERFKALHDVADTLIEYLAEAFEVDVSNGSDPSSLALGGIDKPEVERRVRLTPVAPRAAPMTFVFTQFPSLIVQVGTMTEFFYPPCGCDHCDETAEGCADELESVVFAVVDGGLREGLTSDSPPNRSMELVSADGGLNESGWGPDDHLSADEAERIRARLSSIAGHWAAWPRKRGSSR